MATVQYFIVYKSNRWYVAYDGRDYGPHPTEKAATAVAIGWARIVGREGHNTEVLIQGTDSQFRPEWVNRPERGSAK